MKYASGGAFRRALEDRLKQRHHDSSLPLNRLRKMVAFERLLARLVVDQAGNWVLKGGLALQYRVGSKARTTKDLDIDMKNGVQDTLALLRRAASIDLGDWFQFEIEESTQGFGGDHNGGSRFNVHALLDGRTFERFPLDVGSGDPIVDPIEMLVAPALLEFAEIPPAVVPCYPLTQQIAEKIHAYTRPYKSGKSTREKDMVDVLLAAELGPVSGASLRRAIVATFDARGTHPMPTKLPDPPLAWSRSFRRMANDLDLGWTDIGEAMSALRRFIDPVLGGSAAGIWEPSTWSWE